MPLAADANAFMRFEASEYFACLPVPEEAFALSVA